MRKNFGAKALPYPQPVYILAAYDENGVPAAMNAAWGGVCAANQLCMCIDNGHKTMKNIKLKGEFTVSMGTADQVVACDYVGVVSGNNVPNKLEVCGWHCSKAEFVDAPVIAELPMTMECKMLSYDEESELLIAEIVNVSAEESILNEAGKIDPAKLRPIIFDACNGAYLVAGEKVGNAFSDGLKLK